MRTIRFLIVMLYVCLPLGLMGHSLDLGICAIFQDEAPYMDEWIAHHLRVGVQHFWLYNNNSIDNYKEILKPYIQEGVVDLIEFPSLHMDNDFINFTQVVQPSVYNDCLGRARCYTRWLAIIDLDEFLVPICCPTIPELLNNHFNNASGVAVNWQCYGTSHLSKCKSLLKDLIFKMRWDHVHNRHYKSIVRPDRVSTNDNPHYCLYKQGFHHVNAEGKRFSVENPGVYIDKIRINHYWTRDEWYLQNVKVPRYQKWGVDKNTVLKFAEQMNFEEDPILRR